MVAVGMRLGQRAAFGNFGSHGEDHAYAFSSMLGTVYAQVADKVNCEMAQFIWTRSQGQKCARVAQLSQERAMAALPKCALQYWQWAGRAHEPVVGNAL